MLLWLCMLILEGNTMKNTQSEIEAYERMQPGIITAAGFLGDDARSLRDIIESDEEAMARYGITFEYIADFLEYLKAAGQAGLGEPITIDSRYIVIVGDARGKLPCPWQDGLFHKNSIMVTDSKSGTSLIYSDLSIHMLRVHHFCQGLGSSFRLSPANLTTLIQ